MRLVIDTNVALDLLVFADPATGPLHEALTAGDAEWLATPAMREELLRVLDYPNLVNRMAARSLGAVAVLERFDRSARLCDPAPAHAVKCRDGDDQKFIDLAAQHGAMLLSKDFEVLRLKKRLAAAGIEVAAALPASDRRVPSA